MNRSTSFAALAVVILSLFPSVPASAQVFTATSLADYGNVSVMVVTGSYDAKNPDGTVNSAPRKAIATEFFRTHKDEYDFLVVFSNFDFPMPDDGHAKAFYMGVKNDTRNIGITPFNYAQEFGSTNDRLQGMVDMGNLRSLASDPMDPKFNETLYVLSHEMMHRWGARAKFKNFDGSDSTALLGKDQDHWSFLLDSGGSLLYGNRWQNNGNGTFTSIAPQNAMKLYSPLDLYLMGMIDKSKVPPMLLIDSPGIDPGRLPEAGVTIPGTARTVTIDDIIAAMGPREPDASASQKSFKTAFIYITQPGTFTPDAIYSIENIRNGFVTRHSILTDGASIVEVSSQPKDDIPHNPGILPPSTTPRTSPANISEGVQWLKASQKSDGSWADLPETEERDTAQAVLVLRNFLDAQTNYGSGLQRLGLSTSGNTDFLCRKIEAYAAAGQNAADLLTELLARQNSDGGWGSDRMYQSNPADTGLALKALALAGYGDRDIIAPAISYLIARQNSDGGWGPDDNSSTLQFTAAVLSAFNKYRASYQLEDRISRGMGLIASRQNTATDKGFGNSPSTVYDTATAVLALRELGASTDITNNGLDYIREKQSGDGSWNNSAFQTAIAIDAIYKATVDPDLSIRTADISFIPATITSLPTNVGIEARIGNLGQTAVPEAKVVLYAGSPAAGIKIAEQTAAFAGQSPTTVIFSAAISDGNDHIFTVVVDPDNLIKETSKTNNSASVLLRPEATTDLEVLPQDITLSQNDVDMFADVVITATIRNKGTMTAYSVPIKYFIDEANAPFDITTLTIDSIPANGAVTRQFTWRANKAGVNMPLAVLADPFNTFTELSKTNNKASTTVTVRDDLRPNLTVSSKNISVAPNPVKQGGSVAISALIKNEGSSAANTITVNIYRRFPGENDLLLHTQDIASLSSGASAAVSTDWTAIKNPGNYTILVQALCADQEVSKLDNEASVAVAVLSIPDLMVTSDSIQFFPSAPRPGDPVTIQAIVRNVGDQDATNVPVAVYEGERLLGFRSIDRIAGNSTYLVLFSYTAADKIGDQEIVIIVDPNNSYQDELNKANNRASKYLTITVAPVSMSERYISPNGDGVQDSTSFSFQLEAAQLIRVVVSDKDGGITAVLRELRNGPTTGETVSWDGKNSEGVVVEDGRYTINVLDDKGKQMTSAVVTVDNNRSAFADALGTEYLLTNTVLPRDAFFGSWLEWLPDERGMLLLVHDPRPEYGNYDETNGLYVISPDGKTKKRIVPDEWSNVSDIYYTYHYASVPSPLGDRVAYVVYKYRRSTYKVESAQLYVVNADGSNMTVLDKVDASPLYLSEITWSPDGKYIAYRKNNYSSSSVMVIKSDGTGQQEVEQFLSGVGLGQMNWLDANDTLLYETYAYNADWSWRSSIKEFGPSAGKKTVLQVDNLQKYSMLSNGRLALVRGYYAAGEPTVVSIADLNGGSMSDISNSDYVLSDMFVAPDRESFAFVSCAYGSHDTRVFVSDVQGAVTPVYTHHLPDQWPPWTSCDSTMSSNDAVKWDSSGTNIALLETDEVNQLRGKLIIANTNTGKVTQIDTENNAAAIHGWMQDGRTLVVGWGDPNSSDYYSFALVDASTQRIIQPFSNDDNMMYSVYRISPNGNYITYYQRPNWTGRGTGPVGTMNMSSLLNATAVLDVTRRNNDIFVSGIAEDLNFSSYSLEYVDAYMPGAAWTPIMPIAEAPVVNGVLATWIPPAPGTYGVRLTIADKAGNRVSAQKTVGWDTYSSVSNIYASPSVFSPNAVGSPAATEIHYEVNEPISLILEIYDMTGNPVRTMEKIHDQPRADSFLWDGRNDQGSIVPDGTYVVKILNHILSVEIDTHPPSAVISLADLRQDFTAAMQPYLHIDIMGHADDPHLKEWILEYGEGEDPQAWHEVLRGKDVLAARDAVTNLVFTPIRDTVVNSFHDSQITWLAGKRFRIIAEDVVGNRSTAVSPQVPEMVIPYKWDDNKLPLSGKGSLIDTPGGHTVHIKETIREQIDIATVQYETEGQWFDAKTVKLRDDGDIKVPWDTSVLSRNADHQVRVRLVDRLVNIYYVDIGTVYKQIDSKSGEISLSRECFYPYALYVVNAVQEDLRTLQVQSNTSKNGITSEWKTIKVFDASRGDVISRGTFSIDLALPPDLTAHFRATGITANGMIYEGKATSLRDHCLINMSWHIVQEGCNTVAKTGRLVVEVALPLKSSDASLSIFIDDVFVETVEDMNLLIDDGTSLYYNRTVNIEGKQDGDIITTRAVLNYRDAYDGIMKSVEDAYPSVIDKTPPQAKITDPGNGIKACVKKMGDWNGIALRGTIKDSLNITDGVAQYAIAYSCMNPTGPCPATLRSEDGEVKYPPLSTLITNGLIGYWDISQVLLRSRHDLHLTAWDNEGNMSCQVQPIEVYDKILTFNILSDKLQFSPNGDSIFDDINIRYLQEETAGLKVEIYAADGKNGAPSPLPVRTFTLASQSGYGYINWNGTDDAGQLLPEGKYEMRITARDVCDNAFVKSVYVDIDNTRPSAIISYPTGTMPIGHTVEVVGTADDLHFARYSLEAGQGVDPSTWRSILNSSSPVRNGILGAWTASELEGQWTIRMIVEDAAGNKDETRSIVDLKSGVKNTVIHKVDVSPNIVSPNGDGKLDTAVISYTVSDACAVVLDVLDQNGAVRRRYDATTPAAGSYTITWDGRDAANIVLPDAVYTLRITAARTLDPTSTQTEALSVIVDTTPPTIEVGISNTLMANVPVPQITGTIADQRLQGYSITKSNATVTIPVDQGTQSRVNAIFATLTDSAEGEYVLHVTANDLAENKSEKTIPFIIDRTPPAVKLASPKEGGYYGGSFSSVRSQPSTSIAIAGSLVEKNLDTFILRYGLGDAPAQWTDLVTGTTVTAYPSSTIWKVGENDGVPDGMYTLSLFAKDKAGLTGEARVKVIVDNTAPTVTITSPKEGDYVKAATDITGTADDLNLDKYTLELSEGKCDGASKWGVIIAGAKPVQNGVLLPWKALPKDGEYCIRLTASDKSGNKADARIGFNVDTHPPAVPSLTGVMENKTDARLTWQQNAEPDIAGYSLYRNNQKMNSSLITQLDHLDQGLGEGVFTYTLKAVDRAGWESVPSNEVKLRIDTTGPNVQIKAPQANGRVSGLVNITGTAYSSDDFKQYRVSVGQGAAPTSWTVIRTSPLSIYYGVLAQWETLGLAGGQVYSIKLEAEDISGNSTAHQIAVTIDNTPPAKPVIISAAGVDAAATVTWNTNTESDLAGYLLYRNGQLANVSGVAVGDLKPYLLAPGAGTTVYLDRSLPDGTFSYSVVAMDKAGNLSIPSDPKDVSIDTHEPHAAIVDPANMAVVVAKVLVKAVSADLDIAKVQFEYKKDGETSWQPIGPAVTTRPFATYFDPAGPGYGDYSLRAVAADKGNKTDTSPGYITITYKDLTPPAAPTGVTAKVNSDTVTLTWSKSSEADLDGYNVYRISQGERTKINISIITASPDPVYQDAGLADGSYLYEVKAVDKSSNESNPSQSVSAKIYTPVISQPKSPTGNRTIRVAGSNAAMNGVVELLLQAGATTGTTQADAAGKFMFDITLSDGENSYVARATDGSGNVSRLSNTIVVAYLQGPTAPAGLTTAVIPEGGALRITWDAGSVVAAGYNLYRSDTAGGPYVQLNGSLLAKGEYNDSGLINGTSYYYVVASVDSQGVEGAYSIEAAGVPLDSVAPDKPVIVAPIKPGAPLTVYTDTITLTGYAEPNSFIDLMRNGSHRGRVQTSQSIDPQSYALPSGSWWYVLSPDETHLAYTLWTRYGTGTRLAVAVMSLETGERKTLSPINGDAIWSPDGKKLAYSIVDDAGTWRIWTYDIASGNGIQLNEGENFNEEYPAWSPDGSRMAFMSDRSGTNALWIKDLTTNSFMLAVDSPNAYSPQFSPDGTKLAYFDDQNIFVLDLTAGVTKQIEDNSDWWLFSWSPDSSALAFVSYNDGPGDIYSYSLATQRRVRVTDLGSANIFYPIWSGDGKSILFGLYDDATGGDTLGIASAYTESEVKYLKERLTLRSLERTTSGAFVYVDNRTLIKFRMDGMYTFEGVALNAGENVFSVSAADASGNTSGPSDSIIVTLDDSRLPDLVSTADTVYLYPPMPIAGGQMAVNAAVWNNGATDAHDVDVLIYLWNAQNELELLKTERIPLIASQSAELVSAVWDSTGKTGANRIVVVVDVDDRIAERDETNNMAIRDFSVVDHEGIYLTTALDAASYGSNNNATMTVSVRNSGLDKNAVLETRIEDGNGYPVATFGPRTVAVNYASESIQTYSWNTGVTFATTYSVHALLKEGMTVLAESTAPLVILPDRATKATLVTDKSAYGTNEPVSLAATIGNEGRNWIIPTLRSQLKIKDAAGAVLLSEEKTFVNLLPGTELSHAATWNTGLRSAGDYTAALEVTAEGTAPTTRTAAFTIHAAAVVTGTLTVAPDAVPFSGPFQAVYTLANSGNADTGPFTAQVVVIDPDTQAVMDAREEQITIARNASLAGQAVFTTASYDLKKYTVLLRRADSNATRVLASASMTVKDMTPPVVTILSPVEGNSYGSTISILTSITDNASGVDQVEYRRDDGTWSLLPVSDPARGRFGTTWDPTMADNGPHSISFRATDKAGNASEPVTVTYAIQINRAPTTPSLAAPPDGADVGTPLPELIVNNASDPNTDPLTYAIEVYADSDLTMLIAAAGTIAEGTGTTSWQVPQELTENARYYWRSRAFDGKLYGPWMSTAVFRINAVEDPPSVPAPTSPADGTEVPTFAPVLTVINAVDPDSTSLTYNFQVALDPEFLSIVASIEGVFEGDGKTSWQVPTPLEEDRRYYWRAQADDWTATGPWSVSASFTVNTGNNAPTVPAVIAPGNSSEVTTTSPDIVLQNSIDPDSPVITYSIELDTARTFDSPNLLRASGLPQGPGTTAWNVAGLLDNTYYFVRAKASDGAAESDWSAVNAFFVNTRNDEPSTPVPANPSNSAGVNVFTPTLSVQNATDLDRDVLTYDFKVYEDAALSILVASVTGVAEMPGTTSWTVSMALKENRTYYWQARAFDGELASGWTEPFSFTVNTGDDAPSAPTIVSPAAGSSVATLTPTLTVLNAADPDSSRLTYEFEVFYGSALTWSATGIAEGTAGSTSATLSAALADNTVYSWRCRANDGQLDGPWTAMMSFTVHLPQTGITVEIEVEPETLNKKSHGNWVMVEIELPHGYKASDVDISSIRLEGTVPAVAWPHEKGKHHHEHGCERDHERHDHSELKVKFRRNEVIAVLPVGDHVPVHVTGTVAGTPFEGVDIIKVIH
jgi:Tol biopolymer transport system component/flagellar hook assembly protein FlgD/subtilase family serine protease